MEKHMQVLADKFEREDNIAARCVLLENSGHWQLMRKVLVPYALPTGITEIQALYQRELTLTNEDSTDDEKATDKIVSMIKGLEEGSYYGDPAKVSFLQSEEEFEDPIMLRLLDAVDTIVKATW